jgi:ABC-type arginine transport system permease subunit
MNLFKTLTLKWWQTSIFKIGMLALGIVVGAYLHDLFGGYLVVLIVIFALSLAYITYIWWAQ